jgi:hypothetical protein
LLVTYLNYRAEEVKETLFNKQGLTEREMVTLIERYNAYIDIATIPEQIKQQKEIAKQTTERIKGMAVSDV